MNEMIELKTDVGYPTRPLAMEAAKSLPPIAPPLCEHCQFPLEEYEYFGVWALQPSHSESANRPFFGMKRRKKHEPFDCISSLRKYLKENAQTL